MLAGNIFYSACQWMIVVVLAKLGSPQQVGEYALGIAVASPVLLFATLQLRSLLASDVVERFSFGQYLTFRLVSIGLALAAVAGIAGFTEDSKRAFIVVLVAIAQSLEILSDTYYGYMQKFDRMDRISWSLMARGPLSLGAMFVVMYLTHSTIWAIAALAMGRLIVLLAWDMRLGFSGEHSPARLNWSTPAMAMLLRTALPLGVISMLGSLNLNIPRYFIEGKWGSSELGMFSAVASLLSAGSLVVSAYGQAIFLSVARACAAQDRARFRKFTFLAIGMGAVLGGGAILTSVLFGRAILTHLFRPAYAAHTDVLIRLMIAGTITFVASGLGFVMTAARSLRPQIPLMIVTGIASAIASAMFTPRYGLMGAADAALISAAVQLAGTAVILLRIDRRMARFGNFAAMGEAERSLAGVNSSDSGISRGAGVEIEAI